MVKEKIIKAIEYLNKALEHLEDDNKRLLLSSLVEARELCKESKWITQIEIELEDGEIK